MVIYRLYTSDGQFIKETDWLYPIIYNFTGIVEYSNGIKEWVSNGIRHRDYDKPAIEGIDGHKEWWVDYKRHRIGGPAVIRRNGERYWYIEHVGCSEEEHDLLCNVMKIKGLL